MKFLDNFLDILERHKIGILATIVLHLALITIFLVFRMNLMDTRKNTEMLIDFSQAEEFMEKQIEELQKQIKVQSQQELIKELQEQYNIKNTPVNEAENAAANDAQKSIDQMEQEIKQELGVNDNTVREQASDQVKLDPIIKKEEPAVKKKPEYTLNEKGEPTFFKGATTISYSLKGRSHIYIPTPVYKCEGGGKIVLNIAVNRKGYVVAADINKTESRISEECLMEAANMAALTTRFSEKPDAPERQMGSITFIFVAQ
jgi:hypothetical protein